MSPGRERRTSCALALPAAVIARPLGAAALCSLLVWPAWLLGDEAARWFRWLVDRVVSRSDVLFSFAMSDTGFYAVASGRAWGSWIVYGLVAGLAAMLVTRWLAGRALSWLSVALVLAIWLPIRRGLRPIHRALTMARSASSSVFPQRSC